MLSAVLLMLASSGCLAQSGQELLEIAAIEFVVADSLQPPADDADWKPAMLPWGSVLSDPQDSDQCLLVQVFCTEASGQCSPGALFFPLQPLHRCLFQQ